MPNVLYGSHIIEYEFLEKPELKSHYITVEKGKIVVLKGKTIPESKANTLILKKARWIIEKLFLVQSIEESEIVTGSRIPFLGKKYYVQVLFSEEISTPGIHFNHSKFTITLPINQSNIQETIKLELDDYYRIQAKEKLIPRIEKWSQRTGLNYTKLRFLKFEKRWGSCTRENTILINYLAIKLPYSLIDYLIVHELCHTVEKSHSKSFYSLVSKHVPNWKTLDEKMAGMKM
jgi:predicted metal-dependent hydrolase